MKNDIRKWMAVFCTAGLFCSGQMNVVYAGEAFSYADVAGLTFCFSSGVGAWATLMEIQEDGSFSGTFHDSDMGSSGDGYPNGTVYLCDFSGQFGQPVKVDEYTYSAGIQDLEIEKEIGTTEIVDGIRYVYSEPYGFDSAQEMLFYLPGAPLADLPEEFRSWVGYYNLSETEETELPFTGMYNETAEVGFSSYETNDTPTEEPMTAIDLELQEIAEQAADMEEQLDSGLLAQQEMNRLSGELYMLWDNELNSMWSRIREILPEDEMAQLTSEELDWIADKESAVAEAGAEFEGGTMQPLLENTTAANLTRIRVYELAEYLR